MIKNNKVNDSGFTIVELLAVAVIILIALGGLFVGIQFAEKQIQRNYHSRRALLIASANLEYQYYLKTVKLNYFDTNYPAEYTGEVTIDGPSLYPRDDYRNVGSKITGSVDSSVSLLFPTGVDDDGTNLLMKRSVTVVVSWKEPADKKMTSNAERTRYVKLVEDYYETP